MTMEPFDFERFLKPINQQSPCGNDLKYDLVYDKIAEARREDDPNLPQGIWTTDLKKANWSEVIALCENVLCSQSKDLQIAAWLTEAYLQKDGLPGMNRGLRLVYKLSETYWDHLYPLIIDTDTEFRLAAFEWLHHKLIERIYLIPLSQTDSDAKQVNFGEWVIISKSRNARDNQERLHNFNESVKKTPLEFYESLKKSAESSIEEIRKIEKLLFEKNASSEGQLHKLRYTIEDFISFLSKTIQEKKPIEPPKQEVSVTPNTTPQQTNEDNIIRELPPPYTQENPQDHHENRAPIQQDFPYSSLQTREQAYEYLRLVAEFLAKNEPASPSYYLVTRAISWANINLGDLLKELVKDPPFLEKTLDLLGITGSGPRNANNTNSEIPPAPPQPHFVKPSASSEFTQHGFNKDQQPNWDSAINESESR